MKAGVCYMIFTMPRAESNWADTDLGGLTEFLTQQPLLAVAVAAIFLSVLGGMLRRPSPLLGGLLRGIGTLGLVGALLLTIVQVTRFTTGADLALPSFGLPQQEVDGTETRVPMSSDGHFWIRGQINGASARFLVDTGATLTALSPETARAAGLEAKPIPQSVMMRTANGTVRAELVTVDELAFGNVVARDLDAVVTPGLGGANVIGMNLLSRLAGWRVENRTLILTPNHPQNADIR